VSAAPAAPPRIVVFGASGFTGRLVARHLVERRGAGVEVVLAGRDAAKLERLRGEALGGAASVAVAAADARERGALADAFAGARVVAACAGPFTDLGAAVVRAALEAGAHYLDTTGEFAFVRRVYGEDEAARARGVALVPACAFEIALSSAGAAIAADGLERVDSVDVGYASVGAPSRGTTKSIFRVVEEGGESLEAGAFVPIRLARGRAFEFGGGLGARFAREIPGADALAIARHVRARSIHAYMPVPLPLALAVRVHALAHRIPLLRGLHTAATQRILDFLLPEGPGEQAREAAPFTIVVEVAGERAGRAERRTVRITGRDPYGTTGAIVAAAALRMAAPGYAPRGALAPAEAFPPRDLLADLARDGVAWSEATA
jgi:short subunit dehydrogenase-like uncharacterized protein